jgi:NADH-quinone oxidoreductase subunit L
MSSLLASLYPLLAAAAEGGEATKYSDGGWLAQAAWLIPVVPMVAAFAIVFFGKRSPLKGWGIAVGTMGFVALYGIVLFGIAAFGEGITYEGSVDIATVGTNAYGEALHVEWGWMVDGLSSMMYFVVGVVGLLVFIYAKGYMEGDIRYTWFFASFTLFAGGMLVLVSSPNLIQLIVGWELVGVASWLLIGHYWEEHENSSAAIKAFLTNKVADAALFIGVIIVGLTAGSFRFTEIMHVVADGGPTSAGLAKYAFWGGLALFIGAMGKSAQFPLHVWLPDAMAGPTPVSALMHAATMVTAGVYLIARMFPFYLTDGFADEVRSIMIIVGTLTLFLTGLIALVQNDIKKVLAYSTLSQLGYMVTAMGAGAYTAGLFHLFTHAFFKALLFLGAGSVIHAVHSNKMTDMGGLRRYMPQTYWTFLIGSAALAGIVPLAGFWSKDEILASISYAGSGESGFTAAQGGAELANIVFWIAVAGAFVTAFYMTRTVWLTFFGEYKGSGHPHESPSIMTYPLMILAGFSVVAGFMNVPGVTEFFTHAVGVLFTPVLDHHPESIDVTVVLIGSAAALLGIGIGYRIWAPDGPTQAARDTFRIPALYPLLEHKYYIDDFYMNGIIKPVRGPIARAVDWFNGHVLDFIVNGAGFLAKGVGKWVYLFDQRGLDGAINASGAVTGASSGVLRRLQTGRVQQYAGLIVLGTVLLVAGFVGFTQF